MPAELDDEGVCGDGGAVVGMKGVGEDESRGQDTRAQKPI